MSALRALPLCLCLCVVPAWADPGGIGAWDVVGPFGGALDDRQPAEAAWIAATPDATWTGRSGPVRWQPLATPAGGWRIVEPGVFLARAAFSVEAGPVTVRVRAETPARVWIDGLRVGAFSPWSGERAVTVSLARGTHRLLLEARGPGRVAARLTAPDGGPLDFALEPRRAGPHGSLAPAAAPIVTAAPDVALWAAAQADPRAAMTWAQRRPAPLPDTPRVGQADPLFAAARQRARSGSLAAPVTLSADVGAPRREVLSARVVGDETVRVERTVAALVSAPTARLAIGVGDLVDFARVANPAGAARAIAGDGAEVTFAGLQPGDRIQARGVSYEPLHEGAWRAPVGVEGGAWKAELQVPATWPDVAAADRAGRPTQTLRGDTRILRWQGTGPDVVRASRWPSWAAAGAGLASRADRVDGYRELARAAAGWPRARRVAVVERALAEPGGRASATELALALGLPARPAPLRRGRATPPSTPDPSWFPDRAVWVDGVVLGAPAGPYTVLTPTGPQAHAGTDTARRVTVQILAPAGLTVAVDGVVAPQATPSWAVYEPIRPRFACPTAAARLTVEYLAPEAWRLRAPTSVEGPWSRSWRRTPEGMQESITVSDPAAWPAVCAALAGDPWRIGARP